MEIRIEVLSSAEAEIAMRAVQDIAELREAAMERYVASQNAALDVAAGIERTANAIEESAAARRAARRAATMIDASIAVAEQESANNEVITKSAVSYTVGHAVSSLQDALAKGVQAPAVVEFLAKHNVKRVTELSEYARADFIAFLAEKVAEAANA